YFCIYHKFKKKLVAVILLSMFVIASLFQLNTVQKRFNDIYFLFFPDNYSKIEGFKTNPWALHYRATFHLIKEKPIIGHGLHAFRNKCHKYDYLNTRLVNNNKYPLCSTHPHNFHLQILLNSGIIGFLVFFSFFVSKIYENFKNKNKDSLFYFIIFSLIVFIFFPRPTGSIFSTFFSTSIWYSVGVLFGLIERYKK
ncbi:O-antigen ligase family protein, partial [Pelagibacteraceae bacterium]|nr:O-antigen ligase family protein [Pelagibacteraceae bacterium]